LPHSNVTQSFCQAWLLAASEGLAPARPTAREDGYGWFTEGFDTLDLKEAKALLDELAS
jgi:hypothetical protein